MRRVLLDSPQPEHQFANLGTVNPRYNDVGRRLKLHRYNEVSLCSVCSLLLSHDSAGVSPTTPLLLLSRFALVVALQDVDEELPASPTEETLTSSDIEPA